MKFKNTLLGFGALFIMSCAHATDQAANPFTSPEEQVTTRAQWNTMIATRPEYDQDQMNEMVIRLYGLPEHERLDFLMRWVDVITPPEENQIQGFVGGDANPASAG